MKLLDLKVATWKKINMIQFVPFLLIMSFAANSIFAYVAPEQSPVNSLSQTKVETKKESVPKKSSLGGLNLSNIKDGIYKGKGKGFRGDIEVSVTVLSHKITKIIVQKHQDDSSFLDRVVQSVIPAIIKSQSLDVDIVSGATYSSKGVIAAVKHALTGEEDTSEVGMKDQTAKVPENLAPESEVGTYKDGSYLGEGRGFRGIVKVKVTIQKSKIQKIELLRSEDDASYMKKASSRLIPNMIKKQSTNVDTVSGATFSSNGIILAVRDALKKATIKDTTEHENEEKEPSTEEVVVPDSKKYLDGHYKDGTFMGSGTGYKRGTTIVSVKIKNDQMKKIRVIQTQDDESFFQQAKAVITSMLTEQNTEVDTVSGATFSSYGIIEATEDALKKSKIKEATEEKEPSTEETFPEVPEEELTEGVSGTFEGSAICIPDRGNDFKAYTLSLKLVVEQGKLKEVKDITCDPYDGENEYYTELAANGYRKYTGVITQLLNGTKADDCDIVSGATCSSNAIIKAYKDAWSKVK